MTKARTGSVVFLVSHAASGGVQELWADLANSFRDRGYDTTLAALYPSAGGAVSSPDALPWTFVVGEKPRTLRKAAALLTALAKFFVCRRPAVVFTAMPAANVIAPAAATLAGSGIRVVTSHHTPVHTYSRLLNALDSLTGSLRAVRAVVSVSKAVSLSLDSRAHRYRAKRRVIANALPPQIEEHIARLSELRASKGNRVVVASGRLADQKNYPVLIRAAARMPDVLVNIIGAGPDEGALKVLALELGVSDRVRFLGLLSREEALTFLSEGDVFVQPSLFEGHSLALIEAAKMGLPLVVSDVPVQIEGITSADGLQCGIAVGAHDDKALAEAIQRLLDDPVEHDAYCAKARTLGAESTFGVMVSRYEDLAS